jgi:antitoxin (DNA-binding transcriptional repressor) of toxin-antitoxin stability system
MMLSMGMSHISLADAERDFAGLLARVRLGEEIVIEKDALSLAVVRSPESEFRPRLLSESIALAKARARDTGVIAAMDSEFAEDLAEIIANRPPWNPPAWE